MRRTARPVATIGVFDGVHRGHLAILRATLRRARATGGSAVAITFNRHPLKILAPRVAPHSLMTLRQRIDALRAAGFSRIIVLAFTRRLAALTAEEFVRRVLVKRFRIAGLAVGYDFHFGRGGSGDAVLLGRLGMEYGFAVEVVPPALRGGEPISSTRIRRLVKLGKMREAAALLGRPFAITGVHVRGKALGRTLGFPTVNVRPANELLPPFGVYAVRAGRRPGVANLGIRPAVEPRARRPLLEIHFLAAPPRPRYGRPVGVEMLGFLRPERHFPDLSSLRRQIAADAAFARRSLQKVAGRPT